MRTIKVDLNNVSYFPHYFRNVIGTGRMRLALHKDYLDSLKMAQEDIGFKYIRGHGIFDDEMGIYNEYEYNGEKHVIYNYTYLNMVFDSYLEIGIKPFIELGFMPEKLASGDQTIFWWKGNVTPPKSYDKWKELVRNLLNHLIERYGIDEVRTWPIEVWNEPNLVNFWKDADQKEYFKLYKETVEAIKQVDSELKVGGPAICGGTDYWIEDFIEYCIEENVPIDFFSRHAYSSESPTLIPFISYQNLVDSQSILDDFKSSKDALRKYNLDIPNYITEYNTSYRPDNPVHDTAYNAAYLGKILSEGHKFAEMFSYWTFSDVFEEHGIPKSFLHGGFGLLTFNQIPKPTYYLFKFFSELFTTELYSDDQTKVTYDKENKQYSIMVWNPTKENTNLKLKYLLPVERDCFVQSYIVNEEYGNVWQAWRKMGRPRFPTIEEVELLRDASHPNVVVQKTNSSSGRLNLEIELKPNEIRLIKIKPVVVNTQEYLDLNDGLINPLYDDE